MAISIAHNWADTMAEDNNSVNSGGLYNCLLQLIYVTYTLNYLLRHQNYWSEFDICFYLKSKFVFFPQDDSIPGKPLHNHDIVSVHFNHFHCMGI